jgi:hypothetical protein
MRGFNHSFGYLAGGEDHYTQMHGVMGVDLWRDHGPAYGENGTYGAFLYTGKSSNLCIQTLYRNYDSRGLCK